MSIPRPDLDELIFADLVDDARRLIPTLAPSWTDHNLSDPGITLIEMFASLCEMLSYRTGRITEANKRAFVALLRGPDYAIKQGIDEETRLAVLDLQDECRAVTPADFEARALAVPGVARARCLPRRNLEQSNRYADAPAHVSMVIVPAHASADDAPDRDEVLRRVVAEKVVGPVCLLTTRLHVVAPAYLGVSVRLLVYVFADQDEALIRNLIERRIRDGFAPVANTGNATPRPFGQNVYVSDLYACVDAVPGVDYVSPVETATGLQPVLRADVPKREIVEGGRLVGLRAEADELIRLREIDIAVVRQALLVPEH